MQLRLQTYNKPCEVELSLTSQTKQRLRVLGFDDKFQKYFDRNIDCVTPDTVLRFGCPMSPKELQIEVHHVEGKKGAIALDGQINSLDHDIILIPKTREFCSFIQEFCTNYTNYPPGKIYKSVSGKFRIKHVPRIEGDGRTPARIHNREHFIEVDHTWFKDMSIPMRVFVLCHEYSHIFMNKNPKDEMEADTNGAKIYLSMGYPVIELIYSFTRIFGDTAFAINRSKNIVKWLENNG